MQFRSRAPLRVSFAGGGTDVDPYPSDQGGLVLSATVNRYATATLLPADGDGIGLHSLDLGVDERLTLGERPSFNGRLDLVKAAVRQVYPDLPGGMDLYVSSDAPPGSGLGASSTLVVALLGVLGVWAGRRWSLYELAESAYRAERLDLGIDGGRQDQFAACFGGFNLIEFRGGHTVVNPLRVDRRVLWELDDNLIFCWTGRTRLGARIIASQVTAYRRGKRATVDALRELKQLALDLKDALLRGRTLEFGELLHCAWETKKRLTPAISDEHIDALYAAARAAGAVGGKLLGAGGGGYLLLYCPFDRRPAVCARLAELGGEVVSFSFEHHGLHTWEVPVP